MKNEIVNMKATEKEHREIRELLHEIKLRNRYTYAEITLFALRKYLEAM